MRVFSGRYWQKKIHLGLMTLCISCSKYGLVIPDDGSSPLLKNSVQIAESFSTVSGKLRAYLEKRERLDSVFTPPGREGEEIRFNQPWIRGSSLRYYVLNFDNRERHTVEWRGQWIVKHVSPLITEVRLEVLEVMFMGPPRQAGPGPLLNNQWFELDPDSLRPALELRRFWQDSYPNMKLPATLANIKVPSLEAKPLGNNLYEPHWKVLQRHRAF